MTAVRALRRPAAGTVSLAAALAILVAAWPTFVFDGAQWAFLVSAAAAGWVAFELARRRSVLAPVFVIAVLTLAGPQVNGAIGNGTAPLGTLRLLDLTLAAALAGAAPAILARRAAVLCSRAVWVLAALCAYGTVLWLAHGAVRNGAFKGDVRLVLLAAGMFALAGTCRREGFRALITALLVTAVLTAAKAIAITLSDLWAIGEYDRLQTAMVLGDPVRVILMGGDTLFALVPAVVVLALAAGVDRRLCAVAGLGALAGLLISGTRTSLLVTVALAIATGAAIALARGRRPTRRVIVLAVAALAALVAGAFAAGVGQRFLRADNPHVGLNFRRDEIHLFFQQPARDLLLGRGFGGSYLGKGLDGKITVTPWSHAFPLWVDLKFGLLGLLAGLALLAATLRTALRARQDPLAGLGAVIVTGLLLLSLTLDRLALPEGAVLVGFGLACLCVREQRP